MSPPPDPQFCRPCIQIAFLLPHIAWASKHALVNNEILLFWNTYNTNNIISRHRQSMLPVFILADRLHDCLHGWDDFISDRSNTPRIREAPPDFRSMSPEQSLAVPHTFRLGMMFLHCPCKRLQFTSVYALQTRISAKHPSRPGGIVYRAPERHSTLSAIIPLNLVLFELHSFGLCTCFLQLNESSP